MKAASGLVLIAVAVVAFYVGRAVAPAASQPPPASPTAPTVTRTIVTASSPGLSADEVRAAVRAELDRVRPAAETVGAEEEVGATSPETLERRASAFSRARVITDAGIAAGRWTRDDARELSGVIVELDGEQFDEIMSALVASANSGRMRVETAGSLLDSN